MSPSAFKTAWPSTMPESSAVWWKSMCRSPLAFKAMSIIEWRASCSNMWSRKPMPVVTSQWPEPSRSTVDVISVSLVLREMVACRFKVVLLAPTQILTGALACAAGTERLSA